MVKWNWKFKNMLNNCIDPNYEKLTFPVSADAGHSDSLTLMSLYNWQRAQSAAFDKENIALTGNLNNQ